MASSGRRPGRRAAGRSRLAAAALCLVLPALLGTRVFYSDEEALERAFPEATAIEEETHLVGEEARERAAELAGLPVRNRYVIFHEAWRGEEWLGRAMVLKEIGKTLPFRFLVAIGPDGAVDQVLLLRYREPRGDEISREVFRRQYRGKSLGDPIRRGDDIRNISGATLSVDALSRGVRRALALSRVLGGERGSEASGAGEADPAGERADAAASPRGRAVR